MSASRPTAGGSGALLAGSLVNGLAAYGFIALGTRTLQAEGFAPVAIVWVFWAFSAALLTFPIQHWIIRQMALDAHSGGVRAALGRVMLLGAGVAAAEGVVAAAARRSLFGDDSWVWPACVAGVAAGAGLMGLVRGALAGSRRYRAAAVAIGGENLVRLAVGAALLAVSADVHLLAAALVTGPLIVVAWPRALRFDPPATPAPATGLVGAAGLAVLLAQIVLNGGPPLLAALGGSEAEVTALFSALVLFRAPYLVALGLTVRFTAPLTQRVAEGGRAAVRTPALATAGAAAGLAAAAFVLALGGLALTVMLIAAGSRAALVVSWLAAVAGGAIVLAVAQGLDPALRVVAAFSAAEAVAVGATLAVLVAARGR